jgi:hypothetical protein
MRRPGAEGKTMKPTTFSAATPSQRPGGSAAESPRIAGGAYLTDGTRLLRVLRVDANGVEVEDARTEQLEWHPVGELVTATRAVTPARIS